MLYEYLKNSNEIRKKICDLFNTDNRKVAIVAFVGSNAISYIPNFSNLEIYCWPNPGATNADEISRLIDVRNVSVYFCDNMHKKIYWAENRGVIITSANLTDNALSGNVLQEFGVFIDDTKFNIEEQIQLINPRRAEKKEIAKLRRESYIKGVFFKNKKERKCPSFRTFMQMDEIPPIKLLYYSYEYAEDDLKSLTQNAREYLRDETAKIVNYNDLNEHCNPGNYQKGDVVLQIYVKDEDNSIAVNNHKKFPLTWLVVDAKIDNCVVQINENKEYPFDVEDEKFVKAFKDVFNNIEKCNDIVDRNGSVKRTFWTKLVEKYNTI